MALAMGSPVATFPLLQKGRSPQKACPASLHGDIQTTGVQALLQVAEGRGTRPREPRWMDADQQWGPTCWKPPRPPFVRSCGAEPAVLLRTVATLNSLSANVYG